MRNETTYYPEITHCIEQHLQSNFRARGIRDIHIYWKTGELKSGLQALLHEAPAYCGCLESYCTSVPMLNLDIFAVVSNGHHFELVILEIKRKKAAGLHEWSQLLGYNLVANARYGLLINIDAGASERLAEILRTNRDCSHIVRRLSDGSRAEHLLGFMQWNSLTQNFEYSAPGQIQTLAGLSTSLLARFG